VPEHLGRFLLADGHQEDGCLFNAAVANIMREWMSGVESAR
jgi:hypothetical protein